MYYLLMEMFLLQSKFYFNFYVFVNLLLVSNRFFAHCNFYASKYLQTSDFNWNSFYDFSTCIFYMHSQLQPNVVTCILANIFFSYVAL